MITMETLVLQELVTAATRERMRAARQIALEREASLAQPPRPSRLRSLLRLRRPLRRVAGEPYAAPA